MNYDPGEVTQVRRMLTAALIFAIAASPVAAEIRYTTHIETRKAEATQPVDPMMGMIGAMLASRFPTGDMKMTVGDAGTRVEFANALGPVPAGGIMLMRSGSTVILNPADHTYWTARPPAATLSGANAPAITTKRTGEAETIAGLRTERVAFGLSMPLPLPPGVQLPPGLPTTFTLDGDMWVADQFKAYASSLNAIANTLFPGIGLGGLAQDGLVVRQVTRSPMFGGNELVFTVSDVVEGPVTAELFQIPADYKEVPMPAPAPRR
jgi:hypothetical protein